MVSLLPRFNYHCDEDFGTWSAHTDWNGKYMSASGSTADQARRELIRKINEMSGIEAGVPPYDKEWTKERLDWLYMRLTEYTSLPYCVEPVHLLDEIHELFRLIYAYTGIEAGPRPKSLLARIKRAAWVLFGK